MVEVPDSSEFLVKNLKQRSVRKVSQITQLSVCFVILTVWLSYTSVILPTKMPISVQRGIEYHREKRPHDNERRLMLRVHRCDHEYLCSVEGCFFFFFFLRTSTCQRARMNKRPKASKLSFLFARLNVD